MSKKNSNVSLKNQFKDIKELNEVFLHFKNKLKKFKKKSFLVAVSGGPDSLALAALSKAYEYQNKTKFFYVLINHNIRKDSLKEANQVKNLLKKNGINLTILSNKIKINNNIQAQARNIRYQMISEFCKKNNIKIILTAHNLEDQVETFFIRLSRGSGLTGLSAMKNLTKLNNKLYLCRPFLNVKKKILIKISNKTFGKYFKDPSNKNKNYLRTKIRGLKTPLKKSGINYDQIIKSINNLASSKATIDEYYSQLSKNILIKTKKEVKINLKKLNSLNNEIKIKLINESIKHLKKNYYNPRSKKVINLTKNMGRPNFKKSTLGGCLFLKEGEYLSLKPEND